MSNEEKVKVSLLKRMLRKRDDLRKSLERTGRRFSEIDRIVLEERYATISRTIQKLLDEVSPNLRRQITSTTM